MRLLFEHGAQWQRDGFGRNVRDRRMDGSKFFSFRGARKRRSLLAFVYLINMLDPFYKLFYDGLLWFRFTMFTLVLHVFALVFMFVDGG